MPAPLVSVVLVTHNRAPWLARAIESVLAQTYHPLELIVVDDGSTDETPAILDRFAGRIRVLRQERAGAYAARNLAVSHALGELIAFIDSDDVWRPHRLAVQVPLLQRPAVGLVFGDAAHRSARWRPSATDRRCFEVTPPRRGRVAQHFVWGVFVPTITVLVRRRCLEEVGGFPTSHRISADYLTWFRIAVRHELDYAEEVVADYTVHADGISQDLGASLQARIELFQAELEQASDPAVRRVLERLLVVLGWSLGVAAIRGRAPSVSAPWRVVRACLAQASWWVVAATSTRFVARQAMVRGGRRLRAARARERPSAR